MNYQILINALSKAKLTHMPETTRRYNKRKDKNERWMANELLKQINKKNDRYVDWKTKSTTYKDAYRCRNSKLPIYKHIYLYDSDICTLCNLNSKGDGYQYILICPFFRKERELHMKIYYYTIPSIHKFINLFCSTNKRRQRCLARLANIVMTSFST